MKILSNLGVTNAICWALGGGISSPVGFSFSQRTSSIKVIREIPQKFEINVTRVF
jgi:hypothetical protein